MYTLKEIYENKEVYEKFVDTINKAYKIMADQGFDLEIFTNDVDEVLANVAQEEGDTPWWKES